MGLAERWNIPPIVVLTISGMLGAAMVNTVVVALSFASCRNPDGTLASVSWWQLAFAGVNLSCAGYAMWRVWRDTQGREREMLRVDAEEQRQHDVKRRGLYFPHPNNRWRPLSEADAHNMAYDDAALHLWGLNLVTAGYILFSVFFCMFQALRHVPEQQWTGQPEQSCKESSIAQTVLMVLFQTVGCAWVTFYAVFSPMFV